MWWFFLGYVAGVAVAYFNMKWRERKYGSDSFVLSDLQQRVCRLELMVCALQVKKEDKDALVDDSIVDN